MMSKHRKQKKAATNGHSDLRMSREQIIGLIDNDAKSRLGIGAAKLLRDYKAGKLEDPGEVADLLILAGLLRKNDPIFARA